AALGQGPAVENRRCLHPDRGTRETADSLQNDEERRPKGSVHSYERRRSPRRLPPNKPGQVGQGGVKTLNRLISPHQMFFDADGFFEDQVSLRIVPQL